MNCPTCDMPTIWSTTRERRWCSVYGDHYGHLDHHPVIATILDHEDRTPATNRKTNPNLRLVAS